MTQALNALMTKLSWQESELNEHLQAAEKVSLKLHQQLEEVVVTLNESCVAPLIINPEFEINRLNFVAKQHEKKEVLSGHLKNNQDLEIKLKDKLQRVKTELKMLEKFMDRERAAAQAQQKKMQEQALEEWVIQKGRC